jgi:hypothetical protein
VHGAKKKMHLAPTVLFTQSLHFGVLCNVH